MPDSSPAKRLDNQDWPWQSVFPHPSLERAVEKTNVYITELNCWSIFNYVISHCIILLM